MDFNTSVRLASSIITVLIMVFYGRELISYIMKGLLVDVPPIIIYVVLFSIIYFLTTLLIMLGLVFIS